MKLKSPSRSCFYFYLNILLTSIMCHDVGYRNHVYLIISPKGVPKIESRRSLNS